jgi:YD repeat-containing protein
MCERGFHFCQKLGDVCRYYQTPKAVDDKLIIYEVEALGEIKTEGVKSVTDRLKIVSVVDPQHYAHMVDTHKYDERGNLIKKILLNGNIYSYEYDDRGNMTKEIHPSGATRSFEYEYDDRGNKTKVIYPSGNTHSFEYDDQGNKTKEVLPNGYTYSFEYDERGNKIKSILPSGIYVYEYETYPDFKVTVETVTSNPQSSHE